MFYEGFKWNIGITFLFSPSIYRIMQKLFVIILAGLILLSAFGNATAQEDEECDEEDCEDCDNCRDNSFYYVIIAGLVVFIIFFYLRNREKIG